MKKFKAVRCDCGDIECNAYTVDSTIDMMSIGGGDTVVRLGLTCAELESAYAITMSRGSAERIAEVLNSTVLVNAPESETDKASEWN